MSAVQVAASLLVVSSKDPIPSLDLNTDVQVKGVAVSRDHLVVWSGRTVIVYQLLRDERFTASVEGELLASVARFRDYVKSNLDSPKNQRRKRSISHVLGRCRS